MADGCFRILRPAAFAACLLAANLQAQIADTGQPNPNWFSLGPSLTLNVHARFKDLAPAGAAPAPAQGNYPDGYVLRDSSGNAGGLTWNWGYQNASQVQGNALTFHGATTTAMNSDSRSQDGAPQMGFDLAYGRDLGHVLGGDWGLQAAFDFTDVSIHDDQPFNVTQTSVTEVYSLNGITPPQAPYAGSYNGPGPLINATPGQSTTSSQSAWVAGQRTLDAQVYQVRLGPYYELGWGKHWAARLGGGLSLALVDTRLSYDGASLGSASSEGMDFQAGAYLEGRVLFSVTRHVSLFAGAQYEYLGTQDRNAGHESAQLDLTGVVSFLVGAQWSF